MKGKHCTCTKHPIHGVEPRSDGDCPMHAIKDAHIAPQALKNEYYTISEVRKSITERILRNELSRAIGDLGPQKAAQVVVSVFRLKGLPKELRRHV